MVIWDIQVRHILVILGVNGVAVDRYGLILWENDATGSRKVSRYLPDLREAIKKYKMAGQAQKPHKCNFPLFFCILSGPVYSSLFGDPWTQQPSTG